MSERTNNRSTRLRNLFVQVLSGKQSISTTNNARLFVEAICDHPDPATCIQKLFASTSGLPALQSSLRADISLAFLNGQLTTLLRYLQAPELKAIYGGQLLCQIILSLVDSPLLWNALVGALRSNELTEDGADGFSWLLLQLVSLPIDNAVNFIPVAGDAQILKRLTESPRYGIRARAHRIKHIVDTITTAKTLDTDGPGGRHDNDFSDIHQISILPTPDELASTSPYLPRTIESSQDEAKPHTLALHTANHFRLLREDMLRDLREEIQLALSPRNKRHRGFCIEHLVVADVTSDDHQPWSLQLRCMKGLPFLQSRHKDQSFRKKFFKDNQKVLKHQSVACLMAGQEVIALASLMRDEDLLAEWPPIICLQLSEAATEKALFRLRTANNVKVVQLNTAVFSYEPVLRQLKEIKELSLEESILHWQSGKNLQTPLYQLSGTLSRIIARLQEDFATDLRYLLGLRRSTKLDRSQALCFIAGLQQRLSLIQGPPGTGKSFIGSLIAKAIHMHSDEKILVVCYTHHALDQFLEELLDLGISKEDIVRLGSPKKATNRTRPLSLTEQRTNIKLTKDQWGMLNSAKQKVTLEGLALQRAFKALREANPGRSAILEYLEFQSDSLPFFDAFQVPEQEDNMVVVGKKGKRVDSYYLLDRWCRGEDAGVFNATSGKAYKEIWQMQPEARNRALDGWITEILKEDVVRVCETGATYNSSLEKVNAIHMEKDLQLIRGKRVIGCTTTAAAKYVQILQSIAPGVLLVEEAGEILESHILTALGPETKQLILIGDHKQLRPKVHYDLSVEKGEGYDLNRSLFERLVLKGYPHQILYQQHRMRPEISALVKQLTYPDLVDAPSTQDRPNLRGFQDNLMMINHDVPETEMPDIPDWRGDASGSSKSNIFEAKMTLKCVRYLGQQGYRTDNLVVLTPYLSQLRLLLDELKQDNDPVLNDLDSYDLVRAGLMPQATAGLNKPRIRISTIDNYQGEESDIVVISLTRSNSRGDIGFLSSPERLTVLLSRARDAMIIIGNAETFMASRKGKALWERFMSLLKAGSHIYDGFPVVCQRHANRRTLLRCPEDFEVQCPDGGCSEPCGALLSCGVHLCPQHCHQLHNHSKMLCQHVMESRCEKGHLQKWKCHTNGPRTCRTCDAEEKRRQRNLKAELERQEKIAREQAEHAAEMAELDRKIQLAREDLLDRQGAEERANALEQKKRDLAATRNMAKQAQDMSFRAKQASTSSQKVNSASTPTPSGPNQFNGEEAKTLPSHQNEMPDVTSPAEREWDRQKRVEGATNDALDALMGLTGLNDVKTKVLSIKTKIETVVRQGTDMKNERLGIVLLGNPGTGKTTIARLYAQFLASVGAVSGTKFIELTGSRLANEGVTGARKHVDDILQAGGGAFFLDEAYQLASGHNPGGTAVLDFLLAEIENQVGKIVFILAGYNKEMEKFFEHNPGFDSRMPHRLHFVDYTDNELLLMFRRLVEKKYHGCAKIEDGINGLYARIAVRRLGRGRGREGYGNARALENVWAKISERQADRLQKLRSAGAKPDDFLFTKEDLIGPEPSVAIRESTAWKDLHGLIGLKAVKESITGLVNRLQLNYKRELEEKPPIEVSLNRIFLGAPGTGKTSVGKLYGAILADMGLLSKREVILKNPADFIGSVLGESEKNTKAILKASEGKVLIIDEAYMLYSGSKGTGNTSDPYKTAVIDTIVAEVQSTPGEDRCVLLLGYKEQMEEMLENSNPGLARRFQLSYAFEFENFDDQQLREILELKLQKQGLDATDEAKDVAIGLLSRARDRPNFGNAGDVENLISHAKGQEQKRRAAAGPTKQGAEVVFLPQDFDEDFDRAKSAPLNCRKLFADVVGCEALIIKLEGYQRVAASMRSRGKDPKTKIPFNFIFKGPPGTGKTTTARKMGQMFYDMGLLSTNDYSECSASDLVGQFVGQTGPKTTNVLRKGLGKVLFVDEAYRLAEGHFAKEAIDELVDRLTKPEFLGKMVVILAGYTENMNELLSVNPGLSSRFPEEIMFQNMTPEECLTLLQQQLSKEEVEFNLDSQSRSHSDIANLLKRLSALPSWANGRDVKTLTKAITAAAYEKAEPTSSTELRVSSDDVLTALQKMYDEQSARCKTGQKWTRANSINNSALPPSFDFAINSPTITPPTTTNAYSKVSTTAHAEPFPPLQQDAQTRNQNTTATSMSGTAATERDDGVSDETWTQLQADILANAEAERRSQQLIADLKEEVKAAIRDADEAIAQEAKAVIKSDNPTTDSGSDDDEETEKRRQQEQARLRAVAARRAKLEAENRLHRAREEQERKRAQEVRNQKKLREMGVCPVGFRWIKQSSGYRCAGGSHFIDNASLGI